MAQSTALSFEDANRITRLKTRVECIQFVKNVEVTRPDLATAARRHCIEALLNEQGLTDALLRDIWGGVCAYEEVLYLKHKKYLKAGNTRAAIRHNGAIGGVEVMVLKPRTEGFARMQSAGLLDRTFEFVVLRHAEDFRPLVVATARRKLKLWVDEEGGFATPDLRCIHQ
ncbi:hypothetical protein ABIB42_001900 [Massilia sp. UYP32]|uniref:hypothetical protein n=1 Tax=Massilia sp. UYP32 TaxID=1756386 RepID=UPI003D1B8D80